MKELDSIWMRGVVRRILFLVLVVAPLIAVYRDLRCGYPASESCSVIHDISEFQPLIAALIALVAAVYAVRPVKQQLRVMALQSAVMSREVLLDRLQQLEKQRVRVQRILGPVQDGMILRWREIEYEEEEPPVNVHWAFDMEQRASLAASALTSWDETKYDFQQLAVERGRLHAALEDMSSCFSSIHAPASVDMDGEDYFSDQTRAEIHIEAERQGMRVSEVARGVTDALADLDRGLGRDLITLREKVRQIDNLVLNSEQI